MKRLILAGICCLMICACVPANRLWGEKVRRTAATNLPQVTSPSPASLPSVSPEVISPSATVTPVPPPAIYLSPAIPPALRGLSQGWGFLPTSDRTKAALTFDLQTGEAGENPLTSTWVYALVAPFPTIPDGVTLDELRRAWAGESSGPFAGLPLWMDDSTLATFSIQWGSPAPGSVLLAGTTELLESAWAVRPAWGIVPFEALEPRWKVLTIDGQSPIRKDFDVSSYPLKAIFGIRSDSLPLTSLSIPATNRDPEKMTVLVMTGVTALVRATAYYMERRGILWPGEAIADWLVNGDLTHISNEVPFAEDCPFPNPQYGISRFCSDPKYIALLESVGTDIVELTGNHFQDWGSQATLFTLELYKERGWSYYGGGADLADSRKAILLEHNSNRLAFIGCNTAGPAYAWATEAQPGAAPCDWGWLQAEVARLRGEGNLVIVTFQHDEYYTMDIPLSQIEDFRSMVDAGAMIVNGSQSHVPMGMEFYNEAFIHYGLGNLFFDQMDELSTRREFIDRHIIYDGRLISVELMTAMLENYARPRPMTAGERSEMLGLIFAASIWSPLP